MADSKMSDHDHTNDDFNDVCNGIKCLKKALRHLNTDLVDIFDGKMSKEDVQKLQDILNRKLEAESGFKEIINMCGECHNNLERLEIASVQTRDERGRHHGKEADSGIGSKVLSENPLSGIQEVTPHTFSQSIVTEEVRVQETFTIETSTIEVHTHTEK